MAENIITNANDVEVVLQQAVDGQEEDKSRDTSSDGTLGRMVVDEFSITREEDNTLESGIGMRLPAGMSNGDITNSFSFTITGEDTKVFEMIATSDGRSNMFDFTARRTDDSGTKQWEWSLTTCKATSEEVSASTGDAMEYAVDGIAVEVDKVGEARWGGLPTE